MERGIVEAMSKKLVADGLHFVGIDLIGDKVVEINARAQAGCRAWKGSTRSTSAQPSSKPWSAAPARSPEPLDSSRELQARRPLERPSRRVGRHLAGEGHI